MSFFRSADCKLVASRTLAIVLVAAIFVHHAGSSPTALAQELPDGHPPIGAAQIAADEPPPELTLENLYRPGQKKDFDGKLPLTHWIGDSPSTLLIRRDDTWNQVELSETDGATEMPWPVAQRLADRIGQLDGVKPDRIAKIVASAVTKMKKPTDAFLLRLGKGLAVVSADQSPRWLTRDASGWNDATLDSTARRVAYTRDGDQFVVDVMSGLTMRLTNDGTDTLLDGILDWTYQEEIYGRGNYKGFWFSPDGLWLAMLRIDIADIPEYTLSAAASPRGDGIIRRYTKPGDPIPQASLYLWDLRQLSQGIVPPARLIQASAPELPAAEQKLITGVWWHPYQFELLYCVSDRLQTYRELYRFGEGQIADGDIKSERMLREESPAWIEPPDAPGWLADGSLIWKSELPTGSARLYHVTSGGSVVNPISPESLDVKDFFIKPDGWNVWVTGNAAGGSVQNHAYRIDWQSMRAGTETENTNPSNSPSPRLIPLTDSFGWHAAKISPDGEWFIDQFSTPDSPPSLSVRSIDGLTNIELAQSELKLDKPIIQPEFFRIPTGDEGIELPAMLVRPTVSDTDASTKKTPVVIEIYGGPRSPSVSARWGGTKSLYRELLARRGIATLVVDNRSSGGRSVSDAWTIRGRMGEVELADVLIAAEWLKTHSWVDADRLAIRGWSFGGFLTLYAMTHSDAFAAGIAGGSPTDWREYDSIYTERFMGLPADNPEGYQRTAPLAKAADLSGKLLMIHGEVDDNVHPSNTLRMAEALQKAGKDFDLMIYPGAAHSVSNPDQSWHMQMMTDRFLVECLLSPEQ